jgi:hypothetical protein
VQILYSILFDSKLIAVISGIIDSGGVRRLRLDTLSFRSGGAMLGWHLERGGR